MDQSEAERILAAHGWTLEYWDPEPPACAETVIPIEGEDDHFILLRAEILRALDPYRPPSVAALRRLIHGYERILETDGKISGEMHPLMYLTEYARDEHASELIARAWELGGEGLKP